MQVHNYTTNVSMEFELNILWATTIDALDEFTIRPIVFFGPVCMIWAACQYVSTNQVLNIP